MIDQLGGAAAAANEALHYNLRRRMNDLPNDQLQRIVMHNANDSVFEDFVEHEPWVGPWTNRWQRDRILVDEQDNPVEFQMLDAESLTFTDRADTVLPRLLVRVHAEPGEIRILKIKRSPGAPSLPTSVSASTSEGLSNDKGIRCSLNTIEWPSSASSPAFTLPMRLDLFSDTSDTWSHGLARFQEDAVETAQWEDPVVVDDGPLMASMIAHGWIGQSRLRAEWRLYGQQEFAEVRYTVYWQEHFRILKLVVPFAAQQNRLDGVMGSLLVRENHGKERPLRDWTLLTAQNGQQLGIACPDIFGIDADQTRLQLTLLRSPLMAQHDPAPHHSYRGEHTDQSTHVFRLRFYYGDHISAKKLNQDALSFQRPLIIGDLTRGMPPILPGSEDMLSD